MGALLEEVREDAAYEQFGEWLGPLLKMGLRIDVDPEGNATLGHPRHPGLYMPVPNEDDRDKEIMLVMQRRNDLDQYKEQV